MRLSQTLALVGFGVGNALAACPYAEQLASRSDTRDMPDSHQSAISKRAEGKKGVFYMSVFLYSPPSSMSLRRPPIKIISHVCNMVLFGDLRLSTGFPQTSIIR